MSGTADGRNRLPTLRRRQRPIGLFGAIGRENVTPKLATMRDPMEYIGKFGPGTLVIIVLYMGGKRFAIILTFQNGFGIVAHLIRFGTVEDNMHPVTGFADNIKGQD